MKRGLTQREKRLLMFCIGTVFLVINMLAIREFTIRRKALNVEVKRLTEQAQENRTWLTQRPFWEKRLTWLDKNMPYTDSAGKSQGQLLEQLQSTALDAELKVTSQTLHEALALDHCNEVSLSLRLRGDQDKMLRWLLMLQSPEKFTALKALDLQLDTRGKEKLPQAECSITIARWFNPIPPPGTPAEAPEPEVVNPLAAPDPLSAVNSP
jgi:hypothetical protein